MHGGSTYFAHCINSWQAPRDILWFAEVATQLPIMHVGSSFCASYHVLAKCLDCMAGLGAFRFLADDMQEISTGRA